MLYGYMVKCLQIAHYLHACNVVRQVFFTAIYHDLGVDARAMLIHAIDLPLNCHILFPDYAVKEQPLLDGDMEGGPDYIVLKALDTDGIRIIGSVLGQSIALDYFVSQVSLRTHPRSIVLCVCQRQSLASLAAAWLMHIFYMQMLQDYGI